MIELVTRENIKMYQCNDLTGVINMYGTTNNYNFKVRTPIGEVFKRYVMSYGSIPVSGQLVLTN